MFILWFCWFGFNGGSSLSLATDEAMTLTGLVCFNTNLAAAVATCVTMIFTWVRYGKPDVIVSKIRVDSVVEAAKKALYTGHIGIRDMNIPYLPIRGLVYLTDIIPHPIVII